MARCLTQILLGRSFTLIMVRVASVGSTSFCVTAVVTHVVPHHVLQILWQLMPSSSTTTLNTIRYYPTTASTFTTIPNLNKSRAVIWTTLWTDTDVSLGRSHLPCMHFPALFCYTHTFTLPLPPVQLSISFWEGRKFMVES